jgi:hypothetical protein
MNRPDFHGLQRPIQVEERCDVAAAPDLPAFAFERHFAGAERKLTPDPLGQGFRDGLHGARVPMGVRGEIGRSVRAPGRRPQDLVRFEDVHVVSAQRVDEAVVGCVANLCGGGLRAGQLLGLDLGLGGDRQDHEPDAAAGKRLVPSHHRLNRVGLGNRFACVGVAHAMCLQPRIQEAAAQRGVDGSAVEEPAVAPHVGAGIAGAHPHQAGLHGGSPAGGEARAEVEVALGRAQGACVRDACDQRRPGRGQVAQPQLGQRTPEDQKQECGPERARRGQAHLGVSQLAPRFLLSFDLPS